MDSISGRIELDKYLQDRFPGFKIHPCIGYDKGEILTGILSKDDDYTLDGAVMYYWNTNFYLKEVVIKKYPC